MNEVEYILRIVLKARDELAVALRKAREELRLFANAADSNKAKIDAFNKSIQTMDANVGKITDKFREWRAIMQGTSDDNDGARKSFGDLGKEVDVTTRKAVQSAKSMTQLREASRQLNREVNDLTKTEHENNLERDYAIAQLKDHARQLDLIARKMNTGTEASKKAFEYSQKAAKAADDLVVAKKREAQAVVEAEERKVKAVQRSNDLIAQGIEDQIANEKRAHDLQLANTKRYNDAVSRELLAQITREANADKKAKAEDLAREKAASEAHIREVARRNKATSDALDRELRDLERSHNEKLRLAKKEEAALVEQTNALKRMLDIRKRMAGGEKLDIFDQQEAQDVVRHLRSASTGFKRTSDDAKGLRREAVSLEHDLRKANQEAERGNGIFSRFASTLSKNHENIASLDNQLRGIGWLAAFGFAQQLMTVLIGLAGQFLAVASSAAQAAAAIGGTFVAGVAEALPSAGLLVAALVRVKGVMDAVNQAQLMQQQQFTKTASSGKRVADSADRVRNAQDALAQAHRRVTETQEALTKAREDGRRELQDLIKAENDAKLAAIGAALSQREAQRALIQAQATGDVEGIQRAQLALLQANSDATDALTKKRRAAADAEKARKGGVEGLEGVQNAKRQAEDAGRAIEKAERGVDRARRGADAAVLGTDTAAAKLQFMLAQLSPAEKRLYDAITQFQTLFRTGVYRNITDNIVGSFARAVERVTKIIQMPDVLREARRTSQALSHQLDRVFDAFTTEPMIKQFLRIAAEGRKSLKPVADIIISLGRSFANIAEEAGPALRRLLKFVGDLVDRFLDLTENRKKMTDFFTEGEKHFEAWIRLGVAVIRLFVALAGAGGAASGLRTINDATKALDDLTDKVHDNRKAVGKFFEDSRGILNEVVGVIVALGKEIFKAFSPGNVHNFAQLLKTVVIPAIGQALAVLAKMTGILLQISQSPVGGAILKWGLALFFVSKAFLSTFGVIKGFIESLKFFFTIGESLVEMLGAFAVADLAIVAGIGLLVAAVVFLLAKLGLLDDLWRAIKGAFTAFWDEVKPSWDKLVDSVSGLVTALEKGKAAAGAVRAVLKVVIDLLGEFLKVIGRAAGRFFGGLIDAVSGVVDIITGLLTLNPHKIWDGFKRILSGLGRIFAAAPGILFDFGVDLANALLEGFKSVGPGIINAIINFVEDAWNKTIGGLGVHAFGINIDVPDVHLPRVPELKDAADHVDKLSKSVNNTADAAQNLNDKNLDGQFDSISKSAKTVGDTSEEQAAQNKIATQSIATNWRTLAHDTRITLSNVRDTVRTNMHTISDRMDKGSDDGRRAVKDNFDKAAQAVKEGMRQGAINAKDGASEIKDLTIRGLQALGLTRSQARARVEGGTLQLHSERVPGGGAGRRAMGGYIGLPGQRGEDKGSYALGAGEAVLNWAHQKYVAPAVEAFYGHPFSKVFDRVHAYHAGGPGGLGFAGGRPGLSALFDGHPTGVVGSLVSIVRRLKEHFPGLLVTSTTDHGASTSTGGLSDHPSGHAVDLASADTGLMSSAVSWIKDSGLASQLKQGIHDPGLSINKGVTVPPSFWGIAWGQHANHIHLAMQGALGKLTDAFGGLVNIPRMIVEGIPGGLRSMVQRSVNIAHGVAQERADEIAASMEDTSGLDVGMSKFGGAASSPTQHRAWIRRAMALAGIPITGSNINAQYTLDMGESGGDPNIIQQVHDINSVTGNLARGIAQVIPPTFQKYMLPGHTNIFNPIDNIIASMRYQMATYGRLVGHPGYATGGEIPGMPGQPIPIVAHAREWVLNEFQQGRLARMLGTHRFALKSMLGFHGGPSAFQGGGAVGEDIPRLSDKNVRGIDNARLERLVQVLRRIDDNLLKAAVNLGSVHIWSQSFVRIMGSLGNLSRAITQTTTKADRNTSVRAFTDAMDDMLDENTGVFAKLRAAIERGAARVQRRIAAQQFRPVGAGGVVRLAADSPEASARDEARRQLAEQRRLLQVERSERRKIDQAQQVVQRQLRRPGLSSDAMQRLRSEQQRLKALQDDADQRVADSIQSVFDAQNTLSEARKALADKLIQQQQDIVDKINAFAARATGQQEFVRRIADAIGDQGLIGRVNAAERDILAGQAAALESRIKAARAAGANDLADQLADQVTDLRVQIFESLQQEVKDAADQVNARAERRLGRLDLAGRMLDAVGAVGLGSVASLAGEQFSRGGLFAQRGAALEQQRTGLQGALTLAQQRGNIQMIQDLTDQLAELDVTIQENTKAAFDARVQDVSTRHDYSQSIDDLKLQIIDLEGSISGQVDQTAKLALLQDKANDLAAKGVEIQALLNEAIASGNVQAQQDLTKALLENQVAILQNTQAINEVNGTVSNPQTFSSSAWQRFREAIFTGMGQVLPQFNPNMMSSAAGVGGGISFPGVTSSSRVSGDTNINLYEAGRPVDVEEISSAVVFANKNSQ